MTLTVTAYAADLDGETVHRSQTYELTFTDGTLISILKKTA